MKMTKIETTYLWIVGITGFIKRLYIKAFPVFAVIIGGMCGLGLLEGWANGKVQGGDVPYIFAAAAIFTVGVVLWFALSNKAKLERKRGHYERSKR